MPTEQRPSSQERIDELQERLQREENRLPTLGEYLSVLPPGSKLVKAGPLPPAADRPYQRLSEAAKDAMAKTLGQQVAMKNLRPAMYDRARAKAPASPQPSSASSTAPTPPFDRPFPKLSDAGLDAAAKALGQSVAMKNLRPAAFDRARRALAERDALIRREAQRDENARLLAVSVFLVGTVGGGLLGLPTGAAVALLAIVALIGAYPALERLVRRVLFGEIRWTIRRAQQIRSRNRRPQDAEIPSTLRADSFRR